MAATTLEDLHRQIAKRERELKTLRQELESRRDRVSTLMRRKEELENQLRNVESEIATLSAGGTAAKEQRKPAASPTPAPRGSAPARPKLGELILVILRESGKPMTARELSEEARRRGFQPVGHDPVKSVEARVQELKKRGVVKRASGHPGYTLAGSTPSVKATKPKSPQPTQRVQPNAVAKPAKPQPAPKPAAAPLPGKQPSLRQALLNVLKSSRKPLSGAELAQRVLESGYKSNSASFRDVVWSMLGQMDEVQHVAGKGYQLKRKA